MSVGFETEWMIYGYHFFFVFSLIKKSDLDNLVVWNLFFHLLQQKRWAVINYSTKCKQKYFLIKYTKPLTIFSYWLHSQNRNFNLFSFWHSLHIFVSSSINLLVLIFSKAFLLIIFWVFNNFINQEFNWELSFLYAHTFE